MKKLLLLSLSLSLCSFLTMPSLDAMKKRHRVVVHNKEKKQKHDNQDENLLKTPEHQICTTDTSGHEGYGETTKELNFNETDNGEKKSLFFSPKKITTGVKKHIQDIIENLNSKDAASFRENLNVFYSQISYLVSRDASFMTALFYCIFMALANNEKPFFNRFLAQRFILDDKKSLILAFDFEGKYETRRKKTKTLEDVLYISIDPRDDHVGLFDVISAECSNLSGKLKGTGHNLEYSHDTYFHKIWNEFAQEKKFDASVIKETLEKIFNAIPAHLHPSKYVSGNISEDEQRRHKERFYQMLFAYGLSFLYGNCITCEDMTNHGRSDVVIDLGSNITIIEFKYEDLIEDSKTLGTATKKAMQQIMYKYGLKQKAKDKPIYMFAICVSGITKGEKEGTIQVKTSDTRVQYEMPLESVLVEPVKYLRVKK